MKADERSGDGGGGNVDCTFTLNGANWAADYGEGPTYTVPVEQWLEQKCIV